MREEGGAQMTSSTSKYRLAALREKKKGGKGEIFPRGRNLKKKKEKEKREKRGGASNSNESFG